MKVATLHNDALFPPAKRRGKGKVKPADKPTPVPEPIETADEKFAREYRQGLISDSFGNFMPGSRDADGTLRRSTKITVLGPSPILPAKEVVKDASVNPINAGRVRYNADGLVVDAAGPIRGR